VSLKTVVEANAEWGPSLEITTIISSGQAKAPIYGKNSAWQMACG
jgi:hypothetical protein